MTSEVVLGALEMGGTKLICAIGNRNGQIKEKIIIPTSEPDESIPEIVSFFKNRGISALGIGSFGPLNLNEKSDGYGSILDCMKRGWSFYPLLSMLRNELKVPIKIDTDVNVACIGECVFGAGKGLGTVLYITVGTGIGIGVTVNGIPLHGALHPEGGHTSVVISPDETIESVCLFHRDCVEGFACGPAIEKRWGARSYELDDERVWELESYYLAQLVRNCIMILSPEIVIMGGGVMKQGQLFPLIRKKVGESLGGYIQADRIRDIDGYIVPESLDGDQAVMGCLSMAERAYCEKK